jgi:indole-3-glycerol phosphate synthase
MILEQVLRATAGRVAELPEPGTSHVSRRRRIRRLTDAIKKKPGRNAIIAEIKFASPSRGTMREGGDPIRFSREFASAGCAALSVLTEPVYFHGRPDHLSLIRPAVEVPLLRKDFIIDERQLEESRELGADAVLLIAGVLGKELGHMVDLATSYGLEPLVEVHTGDEVKAALGTSTRLVGINNRDLRTFRTDLSTTIRLAPLVRDAGLAVVSESGFIWPCDIRTIRPLADGFLIGSSIMAAKNPVRRLEGFVFA